MCLIVIFGRCFSGADLLAKRVSEELRYRLIEREAIVERAAAWGVPHRRLREALGLVPARWIRFGEDRRAELAALRGALAEEAADSGAVYCGCEGLLLPRNATPALRMRLNVPLEYRIGELSRRRGLTAAEAGRAIRRADRARRRWARQFARSDDEDGTLYDLVVNVEDGDFDCACKSIVAFASQRAPLKAGSEYRTTMAEFALANRIEVALKLVPETARLTAVVKTDRGLVFLAAAGWSPKGRDAVGRVVSQVPGVRRLVLVDWREGGASLPKNLWNQVAAGWRPWAAGAAVCGLMAGCLLLKHVDSYSFDEVTSVTGTITDTRCAGNHDVTASSERSRCVRDCVRMKNHVRYALLDGTRLYTLSDQALGE